MNHNTHSTLHNYSRLRRKALTVAMSGAIALAFTTGAYGQATTGTIHGTVPVASDESIQITNAAGFNRVIKIGKSGEYSITLPVGVYTVTLLKNGEIVSSKDGITPVAAGAVEVNFVSSTEENAQELSTIEVLASALPPIDMTTTNQVTTITARELQQLPIARTAENIAMLAPGVTGAATTLGSGPLGTPLLSFGGASPAENAYYIDGLNSTNGLTAMGGISLPYGAIQQQQVVTTGYGAQYGRSIGGVINQIGKSGSNEWHFGARVVTQPTSMRASPVNQYFVNPRSTTKDQRKGDLRTYRKENTRLENIYDVYVSGPIIKDKLFFFVSAEKDNVNLHSIGPRSSPFETHTQNHKPKLYAKINWNINDRNILSVTGIENSLKQWVSQHNFDYDDLTTSDFSGLGKTSKTIFKMWVANYTSYITDDLTLNATFGKIRGQYFTMQPAYEGFDPSLPNISGGKNQNTDLIPNGPVVNSNTVTNENNPRHRSTQMSYRVSLDYRIDNHEFTVGIDNMQTWDIDRGTTRSGPGYRWVYGRTDPSTPIAGTTPDGPYVGPPNSQPNGSKGYYVYRDVYRNISSVRVAQKSQYIQDKWQVTPKLLLNIGLRNDAFINYSPSGVPFIRETKPQLAPRLGFSWDVFGDNTFKVFGNAGRYYLALPAITARTESSSIFNTREYFTYSGIDQVTGEPLGLHGIQTNNGGRAVAGYSPNNHYGEPIDPRTTAARNAKAEYSDNFVLGLEKQFNFMGTTWVFGATGVYQTLGTILDDTSDSMAICRAAIADGYKNFAAGGGCPVTSGNIHGSILINPGMTNVLYVNDPDGVSLDRVSFTPEDQGYMYGPKRDYYALTLSLAHQWDRKWFAKIDYTFSRSYGNTEGPVASTRGQGGSNESTTIQWDYPSLMEYSNGLLPNNRKHQLKAYGAYALDPEWTIGGNLFIESGSPADCVGLYGPNETNPIGYKLTPFHWCGSKPSPRGSHGSSPWVYQLSLNANYRPRWAGQKLNFNIAVFNVLNNQTPLFLTPQYGSSTTPDPEYRMPKSWTPPRSVRLSISYDW